MKYKNYFFTILMLLGMINYAFPQAGTIDSTFNGDGIRLYDHGTVHDNGYSIICMTDTSSVIMGSAEFSGSISAVLFRIKENSDIDSTFGVDNGYTAIQVGNQTFPRKMIEQPDGKYLITGTVQITPSDEEFFVARYLTDGSPDLSFNGTGYFTTSYSTSLENSEAIALQSDGKIVLAGRTYLGSFSQLLFCRVNSDGTLDTSFGTNGFTEINSSVQDESISTLGILSNGSIVGIGDAYQSNPFWGHMVIMAKLTSSGDPMPGFGTNGVMIPPLITDISNAFGMKIQNDSIFLTGNHYDASNNQQAYIIKMDSSGIGDPAFGTNGAVFYMPNGNPWNAGLDIMLADDGKIYNSGTTGPSGISSEFLVARFHGDGSFDTSFDGDGFVSTDIRSDWDEASAMDMQPDGKIITTGNCGGLTNSGENKLPVVRYLNDFVPFGADFIADADTTCEGSTVNFTDQSHGNVISWNWTFEGGSPASSTNQHPSVTYSTAGAYDVTLEVTDGTNISTLVRNDMIVVEAIPATPTTPVGPDNVCGNESYTYTTNSVQYADTYYWEVLPVDAGTLIVNDTSATLETSATWTGDYTIKVRVSNPCGYSSWSTELNATLNFTPAAFNVQGGGGFCEGSQGLEVTLDGSEVDVDYELFLDNVSTGTIIAGTGSPISFGMQTDEGIYNVTGHSTYCDTEMYGGAFIYLLEEPGTANQPSGPEVVCANSISDYQTDPVTDADTLIWTLNPAEAGLIIGSGENISVHWAPTYKGSAQLSVYGSNDCGDGPSSDALEIDVLLMPLPVINGESLVCQDHENIYTTTDNSGSTYFWEVSGGSIVSGTGTHEIVVLWTDLGQAHLLVTETSVENCEGTSDTLDIFIDDCTGIQPIAISDFNMYPNPAKDKLNISFDLEETLEYQIEIFDLLGQKVYSLQRRNTSASVSHQIQTNSFSTGLHFVRITTAGQLVYQSKLEVLK